jgi:hypothetical protein
MVRRNPLGGFGLDASNLLKLHGAGDVAAVGEPLLADDRRPHIRDHRDPIFVGEVERDISDTMSVGIESPHVEEPQR